MKCIFPGCKVPESWRGRWYQESQEILTIDEDSMIRHDGGENPGICQTNRSDNLHYIFV
jgi:hypothetical protein